MRVLVLQQPSSATPVDRWLREAAPGIEVTILSGSGSLRSDDVLQPGVRRVLTGDYTGPAATDALLDLCARWQPDRIVSNAEDDVLRAGHARTLFGIPGMTSTTALLFRDKVHMKRLFTGAGLNPVPHREVRCVEEVFAASEEMGPIVLKPRGGAAAAGVHVAADTGAVRAALTRVGVLSALEAGGLMVEPFVAGDVFHVDVAVGRGEALLISPSRYLRPPHTYGTANVASVMCDPDCAESAGLEEAARKLVAGLPTGHGAALLHLEMFAGPDGDYLAGEVACRLGGGLIRRGIRHTYGVDLSRLGCLLMAGLAGTEAAGQATSGRRIAAPTGWILWTATEPPSPAADLPGWVVRMVHTDRPGVAADSVDAKARCLVEGTDRTQIEARIRALEGGVR